jgi:serine/threonine kinase 16
MIADDGVTPILMDLGSLAPAPTRITSRSAALAVQDTAAEQSTMPYRAPELFDVKTGATIDTKVDIWSLGCTLYACLVGKSPFEARSEETGGSLSLCVLGGDWRFPDEPQQRPHAAAAAQQAQQQKQQQQQQQQQGRLPSTSGGGSGGASAAGERSADPAAASTGGGGATTGGGGEWSAGVKNVVRRCLQVEPADRPDIDELIAMVERVLDELEDS